ncbi:TRAP transporter large permease [Oceanicola sp. D3]|uniref:TRAP transporter large permease n=1 Tax=Oceanicola sp. D3 TaxID=2587163 RepID=UPI00111F32CD|nr:TRAP transporter large permease [Oceanicola sp. D3]QDC10082.1 TRAP transporter large permease [Oceanicola sp. D3]
MIAIYGFFALFVLLFFGLPLAFSLSVVGFVGFAMLTSIQPAGAVSAQILWDTLSSYSLSVLPLFVLMGNLVNHAGLSRDLYRASNAVVGRFKGGLAMATVFACGGFAAVSGSSLATAATMSSIALPSMKKYGYSPALSTGSVAAGGTLGILIPPSVIMVIYGTMTQTGVGQLFIAGVLPGLLGILLYALAVRAVVWRKPAAGPAGEALPFGQTLREIGRVWQVLLLFALVIGGIYLGVFTATEAAGVGAAGAFVIALAKRTLDAAALFRIFAETVRTSAMLMAVLVGALIFSGFINMAGAPRMITEAIRATGLGPTGVLMLLILFYLILGCVFDSLAMILLTVPVVFPLVQEMGYDPIWFGILLVVVVEISLITPPIGMNIFIIRSVNPEIPTTTIFKGVLPFVAADVVRLALILLFPAIVLFLPEQMAN